MVYNFNGLLMGESWFSVMIVWVPRELWPNILNPVEYDSTIPAPPLQLNQFHNRTVGCHGTHASFLGDISLTKEDGLIWITTKYYVIIIVCVCSSDWNITNNSWTLSHIFSKFHTHVQIDLIQILLKKIKYQISLLYSIINKITTFFVITLKLTKIALSNLVYVCTTCIWPRL